MIIQVLLMALAQVKASNTAEDVLNEIQKIICLWYRSKKVTKKYMKLNLKICLISVTNPV